MARHPVDWSRSWYDRASRVLTCHTSLRAKFETDSGDSDMTTRSRTAGAVATEHDVYVS